MKYEIEYGANIAGKYEIEANSLEEAKELAKMNLERDFEDEKWWDAEETEEDEEFTIACSVDGKLERTITVEADCLEEAETLAKIEYKYQILELIEVKGEEIE